MKDSTYKKSDAAIRMILDAAMGDNRVRAVLLNGSRANPIAKVDEFSDYDVVFMVTYIEPFIKDRRWLETFGTIFLKQLPDEMTFSGPSSGKFSFLVLFQEGYRIDLTLRPVSGLGDYFAPESLTQVLLDKDGLFNTSTPASDKDYWIRRPNEKEFADVCNEFYWVSIYVTKGLRRIEITYAKYMLENVVRPMFMTMLGWKIGANSGFSVSFGLAGRNMQAYISAALFTRIMDTYTDADLERNWQALFQMAALFGELQDEVAAKLGFTVDRQERKNSLDYLAQMYNKI